MTKDQAKNSGFCEYCAAFVWGKQLCGVLTPDNNICQLDLPTQWRWIKDYGLKI